MKVIALPELRRYAPDALRMVGVPLGQADETADLLVWTEAVHREALDFLARYRARLNWVPRPRLRVVAEESGRVTIDARGASLLECGVRISDLVLAETAEHGRCAVELRHSYGEIFLDYLVKRLRQRGVLLEIESRPRPDGDHDFTFSGVPGSVEPDALDVVGFRRAVNEGIELTDEWFEDFLALFEMLRVPTSERSRSHAG